MSPVRVLVALKGLTGFGLGLVTPVQVLVLVDRGVDPSVIGLVFAVLALAAVVAELPGGAVADVYGHRVALCTGHLLMGAGLVGFAFAQDQLGFVVAAVFLGVGRALDSGALEAWFVEHVMGEELAVLDPGRLTQGLSNGSLVNGLAVAAGAVAGGALAMVSAPVAVTGVLVGASVPLLLGSALLIGSATLAALTLGGDDPRPRVGLVSSISHGAGTMQQSVRGVAVDPVLRRLMLRGFLVAAGLTVIHLAVPIRLELLLGEAGAAAVVMGFLYAGLFGLQGLAARCAPWLRHRVGARASVVGLSVFAGACLATLPWWGVTGLLVAALLCFAAMGPVAPLLAPLLHSRVVRAHRTGVLSAAALTRSGGTAAGSALLGGLAAAAFPVVALMGCGLLAASALPLVGRAVTGDSRPAAVRLPPGRRCTSR